MLAAISVEWRVAGAERGRQVVDGNLDERHQVWPVVAPFAGEGAQNVADDAVDALDLAGCVVVMLLAEHERRSELLVQTRPEGAREAHVAVRYEHVGQPNLWNTDATKLLAAVSAVAVFVVGTVTQSEEPTAWGPGATRTRRDSDTSTDSAGNIQLTIIKPFQMSIESDAHSAK